MATKKNKSIKKLKKSKKSKKSKKNLRKYKTQKGGTTNITNPDIKYTKGNASSKKLNCIKCDGIEFVVRTLTMGTRFKSFFSAELFDNRFKVFTCKSCGFVQIYSNNIKCDDKKCD